MTIERAMEILDPQHRENYDSIKTVEEAMEIGRAALAYVKESKVYVCYQENYRDLAKENGSFNDLRVFANKKGAINWVESVLFWAYHDEYVPDVDEDLSEERFDNFNSDELRISMYWKYPENDTLSFDIVVVRKNIENIMEVIK